MILDNRLDFLHILTISDKSFAERPCLPLSIQSFGDYLCIQVSDRKFKVYDEKCLIQNNLKSALVFSYKEPNYNSILDFTTVKDWRQAAEEVYNSDF